MNLKSFTSCYLNKQNFDTFYWPTKKYTFCHILFMVQYTFRNVNSKSFKLDIDPSTSIADVKKLIQAELKTESPLKLIFKCKILNDDDTMENLKVGQSDFIVVYVAGPKKPAPAPQPAPAPAPQPEAPKPEEPEQEAPQPEEPAPEAPHAGPTAEPLPEIHRPINAGAVAPHPGNQPAAEQTQEFQDGVQSLIELGFERSECEAALNAAFGNVERAAEYLFSGEIPQFNEGGNNSSNPGVQGAQQIRQLLSQCPEALENVVRILEQQDPNTGAILRAQPELFLQDFGLDPANFDCDGIRNRTAQPIAMPGFDAPIPQGAAPAAGAPQNQFAQPTQQRPRSGVDGMLARYTPEEQDSIKRIQEFTGAPIPIVIQCFEACDKNVEMTCNLVFQMND